MKGQNTINREISGPGNRANRMNKIHREGITAAYEDGVLKFNLPKKEVTIEKPNSRVIEIG